MTTPGFVRASILLLTTVLAGCATNRSELRLSTPVTVAPANASGDVVVIRSVVDERIFEEKPREPSTPSLGFGGAANAPAEVRARAIGRKRNTYGKALGDILLEPGQTVEQVLRDNMAAALGEAGFQVKNAATAGDNPIVLDVHVRKFWSWVQPGFWAIKLHANIDTELVIEGADTPLVIDVQAQDSRQAATERAWLEIIEQAMTDYRAQLKGKAGQLRSR